MKVELREAKRRNFRKIAQIYADEFSKPPYNEPWTLKKAIDKIKVFSKYCEIWEIVYGKELVGFIVVNPNQFFPGVIAFGEEIAIKKEFQNKGIGTVIFKKIFQIYKKRGFKWFMGIALIKAKALKLYTELGFNIEKEEVIISKKLN
ncbi:MAG: GNAT family N-acetyltransferase [Nanoarchaeota archaeon]|nr:GNAT family N-acetyltransferase [Nanoarchaeota archaeon]